MAGFTYSWDAPDTSNKSAADSLNAVTRAQEQRDRTALSNYLGCCGEKHNVVPFSTPISKKLGFSEALKSAVKPDSGGMALPKLFYTTLWQRLAPRPAWTYPAGMPLPGYF